MASDKVCPFSITILEDIANKYGTPYQLYDVDNIINNLQRFLYIFNKLFKNFKQHFAIKALPNPAILKILIDNGCGLGQYEDETERGS